MGDIERGAHIAKALPLIVDTWPGYRLHPSVFPIMPAEAKFGRKGHLGLNALEISLDVGNLIFWMKMGRPLKALRSILVLEAKKI